MAWPIDEVLPVKVLADLGGWADITSDVLSPRQHIQITAGRGDEAAETPPSKCRMTLDNRTGDYSPRNPTGQHHGTIGRNTPLRVVVDQGAAYLALPGTDGAHAAVADTAAIDVTGDIDIRVDYRLEAAMFDDDGAVYELIQKWGSAGNRSWRLLLFEADGGIHVQLGWSTDGSDFVSAATTAAGVPLPGGRCAVRATLDVNNGAGGRTATFYKAPTIDGPWEQLSDPVVASGATSIHNSTAALQLGDSSTAFDPFPGEVYAVQLYNGIDGTAVVDVDFAGIDPGDTSFSDDAGRSWTVEGDAEVTNRRHQFFGEVAAWPQQWDPTGKDVYTPIEAAGILRRLTQGEAPTKSTYRTGTETAAGLVAYWPCEEPDGAESFASALPERGLPMHIAGAPRLASYDGFLCSAPLPELNDSEWTGRVAAYDETGETQVRWLMKIPDDGSVNGQTLVQWNCSGTANQWELQYLEGFGGSMRVVVRDDQGTEIENSGTLGWLAVDGINGKDLQITVAMEQVGSDVEYAVFALQPNTGAAVVWFLTPFDISGRTVGRVKRVTGSPLGGHDGVVIGHIHVQNVITSSFENIAELDAFVGEPAGRRFQRLCAQHGIDFRYIGDLERTAPMGPQTVASVVDLLRECAATDGGLIYEPTRALALGYRTLESLYNQPAAVVLDYEGGELSRVPEPVDDDQATRNDVTASKPHGSSARAVLEVGALSVQPPPDGVGQYDTSEPVNPESDLHLPDHAGWLLHLGTVDEARYPQISVNRARQQITSDAALSQAILDLEPGDRITIDNMPEWVPPETVAQIVQGHAARLAQFEHSFEWNCSPASPFDVAVFADGDAEGDNDPGGPWARFGPAAAVLDEDLTTTETGVNIDAGDDVWTTDSDHYPFDLMIGGERMTATGIGALGGGIYTLTVVRSVNGVVKTHDTGAGVRLFRPAIRPL